ncbi:MAG: cupin domain-containing protein [Flavobacteriales bacterium]
MLRTFHIICTLILSIAAATFCTAQKTENLPARQPAEAKENVTVEQLATDSLCTAFQIWISTGVMHHFHQSHTECIYILEGEGQMTLADSTFTVRAGDFVMVPKGTVHAVTATTTMKVLSIQSPQWVADDRKFVEPFIRRPHNE